MQRLIWTNAKGDSINLTSGNFGITNWEGFSNSPLNVQSQQVPFEDGSVFLDGLIENRELSVTLALNDDGDLEKRYRKRRELIKKLNPQLGEGYLIYTNDFISKRIKCIAQIPIPENHNSNDTGTPKFSLSWTACDPYWEDLEETQVYFGIQTHPEIQNNGDVPAQMKIDFFSNEVSDPKLTRENDNTFIKFNGELTENLLINTNIGQKEAVTEKLKYLSAMIGTFFSSVIYSGEPVGKFVAVGESGMILTSPDGVTWTAQTSGVDVFFKSVTYSEPVGKFVAVGEFGMILTSPDGVTWTAQTSGVNTVLYSIVYSEKLDKFVITGELGTILYSQFEKAVNQIQNLSEDSNMNLNLPVGKSTFRLNRTSGSFYCRITFRQKYVGV